MIGNKEIDLWKHNDPNVSVAHFTNWETKDDFVVFGICELTGHAIGKLAMKMAENGDVTDGRFPVEKLTTDKGWHRVDGGAALVGRSKHVVVALMEDRLKAGLRWMASHRVRPLSQFAA